MGLVYGSQEDMPYGMRELLRKKEAGGHPNKGTGTTGLQTEGKKRKYKNTPTTREAPGGGMIKFRSKKEAQYYDQLMALVQAGSVRKLRLEVQYLLQPSFTDAETGEHMRGVNYYADFVYELWEGTRWTEHIVDTKGGKKKGTRTAVYLLKRKMMAERGYRIEEV